MPGFPQEILAYMVCSSLYSPFCIFYLLFIIILFYFDLIYESYVFFQPAPVQVAFLGFPGSSGSNYTHCILPQLIR